METKVKQDNGVNLEIRKKKSIRLQGMSVDGLYYETVICYISEEDGLSTGEKFFAGCLFPREKGISGKNFYWA